MQDKLKEVLEKEDQLIRDLDEEIINKDMYYKNKEKKCNDQLIHFEVALEDEYDSFSENLDKEYARQFIITHTQILNDNEKLINNKKNIDKKAKELIIKVLLDE
ncbi:MAG: hypothetical protein LBV51_05045 [Acholeplasmatales bacterium]|jgi:predicted outer membrane protein|nr:hypothetical protein [Acholeplasmatales bacterium]